MKLHVIDYGANSDLPDSVKAAIPDDTLQTIFRAALNSHLRDGKPEMHAYIKAWRAMSDMGCVKGEDGTWTCPPVRKAEPGVGDGHVDTPIGAVPPPVNGTSSAAPAPTAPPGLGPAKGVPRCGNCQHYDGNGHCLMYGDYPVNGGMLCQSWTAAAVTKYVPPAEVQASAKTAMGSGIEVLEITEALAKGEGLGAEEVRAIAAHFLEHPESSADSSADAWGGAQAAKWASRVIRKYSEDQPRAANGEFGEGGGAAGTAPVTFAPSERMLRAMAARVPCGVKEQKAADEQERILSKALGMPRTPDNSPFDLKAPPDCVEIKTMLSSKNGKVTMSKKALAAKYADIEASGLKNVHTVVADRRSGATQYYIAKGVGSFRVSSMTRATIPEIRALVHSS